MKPKQKRALTLALAFALLAGLAIALARPSRAEAFSRSLGEAARSGSGPIQLRSLVHQPWERVYIFGPYSPPQQVRQTLGFDYTDAGVRAIYGSDTENLLLFVSGRAVVLSALHPRNRGDFDPGATGRGYTPDEAVFSAERRQPDGWIVLRPAAQR